MLTIFQRAVVVSHPFSANYRMTLSDGVNPDRVFDKIWLVDVSICLYLVFGLLIQLSSQARLTVLLTSTACKAGRLDSDHSRECRST